ncbi:MAG: hypothetical protein A3I32_02240 [Candidatus Yanofskybacteria bacterium RIFCSPLOWO2_02_FULL_45_10]|uniref:GGDEF domain-containing protein n=2 Tax=Candidatus Yanofskyibacteriota TaxID=1752733 RepID=A0A1F8G6G6_9BACT|nr:MAG: hypothetical protein A3F25_01180 [Candidatus Yanofskybacteria bacterium RIFCSPHIGHO2_12_FULL_45_19b]OGN32679.1 MAG: hypothetical protein A3I32_02240 [Candidatus Yanofskybacteria bacterium RIFCSPLOWO2_02_FULL_45_10]
MDEEKSKELLFTRIKELESQVHDLEKDLIHDTLTGLKTRAFFEEEARVYLDLTSNVNIGKRKEWFGFKNISFLFFDIDHFKQVNDQYSHAIGDLVLQTVAKAINQSLREGDTVARWGGEEMVASLLGASEVDAKSKAEDIRTKIASLQFSETPDLRLTISIGVVSSTPDIKLEELIKRADQALYFSKQNGRNRVTTFSELPETN